MVSRVGGSGSGSPPPERSGSVSPCKMTLPGSGLTRSVSVVTQKADSPRSIDSSPSPNASGGFLSRMASAFGRKLATADSPLRPSPLSTRSVSIGAPPKGASAASSVTYSSSSGAQKTLSVSDLPSAASTAQEYGDKIRGLFSEPGDKIAIELDSGVDVIGRPVRPSLDDAVSRLTNLWREGSFKGLEGHEIPSPENFAATFRTEHGGDNPKISDYRAFVKDWQKTALVALPEERRVERMDIAYREIKDGKQTAKDLVRQAIMTVDGSMAPDLSKAAAGTDTVNATMQWLAIATSGIADEDVRLRVRSSLQQGILAPVNQMADLLFNRAYTTDSDGASLTRIEPRSAAHVNALRRNEAVAPNMKEWVLMEDRGLAVTVDSARDMIKAKLYFELKSDDSFHFEGNITVDAKTGAASLEIMRIP